MVDIEKIEKELDGLPEGWIMLLETSAENSLDVAIAAVKALTDKKYKGIILSANRPYSNLIDVYKRNNINTERIFVLDCISKSQNINLERANDVLFLESASALSNISISIDETIKKNEGKKFIFIDSITAMLIHNKSDIFVRFIHYILTALRIKKINGLLISLGTETNKEVRAEIVQLCDKVIKV